MNREELERILPHRNSMLLLDSAELDADGSARGVKKITGKEFFLDGHFPGNPIVPGVILCEILAQSACVLLADSLGEHKAQTLFTGLNNVKFRRQVRPGDTLTTRCRIVNHKGVFYWAEGKAFVGDELCVSAQFSFAVIPQKEE